MSHDILSNACQTTWHINNFGFLADLAEEFGWVPEHKGNYYIGNDWQIVSTEDANAMARAIERAIAHLEIVSCINSCINMVDDSTGKVLCKFEKTDIEQLRAFVDLASAGGFTIS